MTKLSFSGIGEADRNKLKSAGIKYQILDKASETIVIDDADLKQMLDAMDFDAEQSSESAKFEGIIPMKLSRRRRPHVRTRTAVSGGIQADPAERVKYISVCGKRLSKLTKEADKVADKLRKKLVKTSAGMIALWRKEAFGPEENTESERRERLLAEFESLKTAPRVQSVRIVNNTVVVKTDLVTAADERTGYAHEIGRFTILIDLDGKNGGVRWFNRDRRVDAFEKSMNAPNVFGDGTAHFNDLTQPMLELTARLELSVVVDLAIQFVENGGAGELGSYINLWPRH
jgi:uncharacterized glyoxalase superfamily protein PhnB